MTRTSFPTSLTSPTWVITDAVVEAAQRGWTPEDLRHLLGPRINHYIAASHHRVAPVVGEAMRQCWRRQTYPALGMKLSAADIEEMLSILFGLPPLRDENILTDMEALDSSVSAGPEDAHQKIREKVANLLRKAESTTFENEAEALVAKAQQLRQRYRLNSVLDDAPCYDNDALFAIHVHLHSPWARHQYILLANIAAGNSCSTILMAQDAIASVIGHPQDIRHTVELFTSLNRQREHFVRTAPGAAIAARAGQTTSYRRSFFLSYASRIGALLQSVNEEMPDSKGSDQQALVLLQERGKEAANYLSSQFSGSVGMSFSSRHRQGSIDGHDAASRAHLGAQNPALS